MPMPPDFEDECLYTRARWFLHDVVTIDVEGGRVVASLDTTQLDTQVRTQVLWPGHEPHVPGAVMVQITGTLGNLHAVYVLGLRPTEGWYGFGTHIKSAKFPSIARIGPPAICTAHAVRVRSVRGTTFVEYDFRYEQEGRAVYESRQMAAWMRTDHRGPPPGPATPSSPR